MRRRRGRHGGAADIPAGHDWCELCGKAVPVGPDGRCGLGHRVRSPEPVEEEQLIPGPAAQAAAEPAGTQETTEPAPTEGAGDIAAEPVPHGDDDDPFATMLGAFEAEDEDVEGDRGE